MGSRPNNQLWSLDQTFHFWSYLFFLFVCAHVNKFFFFGTE
jgi:hypothetical protein